jgi:hypothetical protein
MLFTRTMLTILLRLVGMSLACRREAVGLLSSALLLLCSQASGEKPSPAASEPTTPAAANSPANAVLGSIVGKVIPFTRDSERYRVSGWNKTEGDYAWSEGTSARLALPISTDAGPLTVKMTLRGLVQPPALPSQPVEVYANNQKIADWLVADRTTFKAGISAEVTKSGGKMLNLELRIPKAASPQSLGMNNDGRILGVCCYSIELTSP